MGMSPAEVGRLSMWQFQAALDGWNAAHKDGTKKEPMSQEEFDDMFTRLSPQMTKH